MRFGHLDEGKGFARQDEKGDLKIIRVTDSTHLATSLNGDNPFTDGDFS